MRNKKHKFCKVTPWEWMNEVPLFNHEMEWLGSFRKRNLEMRKKLEDMGVKKDFMLANNEFGLNWNWRSYPGFNRYTLSLINLEQGLEMFKSGMDSMALWNSLGWGFMGKTMLMDHQYGNRMNPVYFGLEMLWQSVGWEMLEMTTPEKRLHGFCATNRKMGEYTCKKLLLLLYFRSPLHSSPQEITHPSCVLILKCYIL